MNGMVLPGVAIVIIIFIPAEVWAENGEQWDKL